MFLLIAVRRLGSLRLQIWQIMGAGALVVLAAGAIGPAEALRAIDLDVMLFLFGVFFVGQALLASGYLYRLGYRLFSRARSTDALLLMLLFGLGGASALLMNDTLAIVGTALVLRLAAEHRMQPKPLLLALAFAVTIGSVASPIGNPQNLLIAIGGGVPDPFVTFLRYLGPPTLINLGLAYLWLRLLFADQFHAAPLVHKPVVLADPDLARLARASLLLLVAMVLLKVALVTVGLGNVLPLTLIALVAALPPLLFSARRWDLLRDLDWHTLVFFAAMFVLMDSVWQTGQFQAALRELDIPVAEVPAVIAVSLVLSQFISNVPMVALYLPMLDHAGASLGPLLALAAGSTVAGNLLIMGAASNVIIVQNAERRGGVSVSFLEFFRIGAPLALANALVYWLYLTWFAPP